MNVLTLRTLLHIYSMDIPLAEGGVAPDAPSTVSSLQMLQAHQLITPAPTHACGWDVTETGTAFVQQLKDTRYLPPQVARIALLRSAIRAVLTTIRGSDIAHAVVDTARPNQGLTLYLRRILEDTK